MSRFASMAADRSTRTLVAVAILLSSCTAAVEAATLDRATTATPEATTAGARAETAEPRPSVERVPANASYIGRPINSVVAVYDAPEGSIAHELQRVDGRGVNTAVAVVGAPGEFWTKVQLAVRPNFTTGWVRSSDVEFTWTTLRIVVDLGEQRLTVFDGKNEVIRGTVAIGNTTTPTPTGATFVSELLASSEPEGLYGPFALGLALFSDTVTEYAGGNGQVGIHGTNRPDLLGKAVSLGCVRVSNDLISELAGRVPLGTPVEIVT